MQKKFILAALAGLALVCGCNKDIRSNTEKIDALTQKMFVLQQKQAQQLANVQKLLASLPVQLDETQLEYFVKGQEKALFYQTNVLFLLVTVDKRIQSQLQEAADARAAASKTAHDYHTNETELTLYSAAQIIGALTEQEQRIMAKVQTDIQQSTASVGNLLTNQIRQLAADKSVENQLKSIAASLAQLQRDLEQIKTRMAATTNSAAVKQ
jgi:hypothetical protein